MTVRLLPQAVQDLDGILEPLLSRVMRRLAVLEQFPELGTAMAGPFADYRCTVVDFFRLVYRLRTGKVIEIAFIRDCRRRFLGERV